MKYDWNYTGTTTGEYCWPKTTTYPLYGYTEMNDAPYVKKLSLKEQIQELKKLEDLKFKYKVQDFHIVLDVLSFNYLFLTNSEVELLDKYKIPDNEIQTAMLFEGMLTCLEKKLAKAILICSDTEYDNLEDLVKDYLVLKISGVEK